LVRSSETSGGAAPDPQPLDDGTPGAGGRALTCTLAAALAFAAAVMVAAALDLGNTPLRSEISRADAAAGGVEFYEGSKTAKTLSTISFWASAASAAAAVLAALVVAATRRWNRALMPLAGLAVVLGGTGILINNF